MSTYSLDVAQMTLGNPRYKNDLLVLAALFLFELSLVVIPMAIWMKGDRSFAMFLPSKPGIGFLLAIGALVIAGAIIIHQYLAYKRESSSQFSLLVTMNLLTVMLVLVTGEIGLRAVSNSSVKGDAVGVLILKPRNWEMLVQHYRQVIDRLGGELTYLVYDDLMGWTVGPSRKSANGLYRSSSEGIRASEVGISYADSGGRPRIALTGDSFTFGEDVIYEETWGYLLEKELGSRVQVLNFGVGGYGVDQIFLRYEKDIRKWKPKIIIFAFISHDAIRSMLVYPFISLPEWNMPFSKPRFILRDGKLTNINAHPSTPQAIFSTESISDLPGLEYDLGYKRRDWTGLFYHQSYLARLFVSWIPRWSIESPDVSDEALVAVNASILKAFARSATEAGIIPMVVIFPNKEELATGSVVPLTTRLLQQSGVAYTDVTSCLLPRDAGENTADRFGAGRHFSPKGNILVAKCLQKVVNEALGHGS